MIETQSLSRGRRDRKKRHVRLFWKKEQAASENGVNCVHTAPDSARNSESLSFELQDEFRLQLQPWAYRGDKMQKAKWNEATDDAK